MNNEIRVITKIIDIIYNMRFPDPNFPDGPSIYKVKMITIEYGTGEFLSTYRYLSDGKPLYLCSAELTHGLSSYAIGKTLIEGLYRLKSELNRNGGIENAENIKKSTITRRTGAPQDRTWDRNLNWDHIGDDHIEESG